MQFLCSQNWEISNAPEKAQDAFFIRPFYSSSGAFFAAKSAMVMEPAHNHHFVSIILQSDKNNLYLLKLLSTSAVTKGQNF